MKQVMTLIATLFNRYWWWKSLIVLLAMAVMAGLGEWQLDRLEQRRAYNALVEAQLASAPIAIDGSPLVGDPDDLHNRKALVSGEYDYANQIALKNQSYQGQPGVYLVTPLKINGSDRAILVNRGWVPYDEGTPDRWGQFDESARGELRGHLQKSRTLPGGRSVPVPETPQTEWFWMDIPVIGVQMPYELLPVYFDLAPEAGRPRNAFPARLEPVVELDEGNHLGYALQWYAFALIAGAVYIGVVRHQEREQKQSGNKQSGHKQRSGKEEQEDSPLTHNAS
jgi:surfeit locus 1 family protein